MPSVILLNGPPGIGKSTLAHQYAAAHPLCFCLDIDSLRRSIGGWQQHPAESGALARQMAVAMINVHVGAGHDVILPQYLGRPDFIEELERTAAAAGARFRELVLMDSRENAVTRFAARASDASLTEHHREAAEQAGGDEGLREMYDRLHALLSGRPDTRVITTTAGDVAGAYRQLADILETTT